MIGCGGFQEIVRVRLEDARIIHSAFPPIRITGRQPVHRIFWGNSPSFLIVFFAFILRQFKQDVMACETFLMPLLLLMIIIIDNDRRCRLNSGISKALFNIFKKMHHCQHGRAAFGFCCNLITWPSSQKDVGKNGLHIHADQKRKS